MILNGTDRSVDTTEDFVSTEFSIDTDSLALLFKGFSDSLYSNKIGSIVREITSNCFDSHVEAGVTRDVEIEIYRETLSTNYCIIFRDFGVGLSPDRIKNVYSRYFASTKRTSNDVIGGFGIGCKTPLSYTDIFTVRTVFDGTEYTYAVHRGVKVPELKEIDRKPTDKGNGTEIIIDIKNNYDLIKFKDEIHKQLMYFEGITYINCDVSNDYQIYAGKNFLYRTDNNAYSNVHAVIGRVAYPLDLSLLNELYSQNNTRIGLKFNVGEIPVTMNRESIEYTDDAVKVIKERLYAAYQELQEIYDKSLIETDDIFEVLTSSGKKNVIPLAEGIYLTCDRIKYRTRVYTPFKDNPELGSNGAWSSWADGDLFGKFLEVQGIVHSDGKLAKVMQSVTGLFLNKLHIRRLRDSLGKRKSIYIADTYGSFYVVRLKADWETELRLGISKETKTLVRKHVLKAVLERSESYDEVQIPQDWMDGYLEELKEKSKLLKDKTNISVKYAAMTAEGCVYTMGTMTYNDINSWCACGGILIYSTYNQESLLRLEQAASILAYNRQLYQSYAYRRHMPTRPTKGNAAVFLKVSEQVAKNLARIPGTTSSDEFSEKYKKLIIRTVTCNELSKLKRALSKLESCMALSLIPGALQLYTMTSTVLDKTGYNHPYATSDMMSRLLAEHKDELHYMHFLNGHRIDLYSEMKKLSERLSSLGLIQHLDIGYAERQPGSDYLKELKQYLKFKKILRTI